MKQRVVKNKKVVVEEVKGCYWEAIIYPDSSVEEFRDVLNGEGVSWVCSPLHNQDIDLQTGEKIKAHYHLLIDGKTGKATEKSIMKKIKCIFTKEYKLCLQKKDSFEHAVLYMTHDEYSWKKKYDKSDITFSEDERARIEKVLEKGTADDQRAVEFMLLDEIEKKNFRNFGSFLLYLKKLVRANEKQTKYKAMYDYYRKNFSFFRCVVDSLYWFDYGKLSNQAIEKKGEENNV